MSRNLGALTFLDPSGPAWPVMGVLYLFFLLLIIIKLLGFYTLVLEKFPEDGTPAPKPVGT
jgi:hypothetical protein